MILFTIIPLLAIWIFRICMAPLGSVGGYFDVPSLAFVVFSVVFAALSTGKGSDFFLAARRAFKSEKYAAVELKASSEAVLHVIKTCSLLEGAAVLLSCVMLAGSERGVWGLNLAFIVVSVFYMSFFLIIQCVVLARLQKSIFSAHLPNSEVKVVLSGNANSVFQAVFSLVLIVFLFFVVIGNNALVQNAFFPIVKFPLRQIVFFAVIFAFSFFTAGISRDFLSAFSIFLFPSRTRTVGELHKAKNAVSFAALLSLFAGFFVSAIDVVKVFIHFGIGGEEPVFFLSDAFSALVISALFCLLLFPIKYRTSLVFYKAVAE